MHKKKKQPQTLIRPTSWDPVVVEVEREDVEKCPKEEVVGMAPPVVEEDEVKESEVVGVTGFVEGPEWFDATNHVAFPIETHVFGISYFFQKIFIGNIKTRETVRNPNI